MTVSPMTRWFVVIPSQYFLCWCCGSCLWGIGEWTHED